MAHTYAVQLTYFRQTGRFLSAAETTITADGLIEIWDEIDDMRRMGSLPGLRPGSGRDLFVLVDVPDHPKHVPHLVMAPFLDEDDITPPRIPTGEMLPMVRVPLAEIPRTTTRDVVKPPKAREPNTDEEVTPVDVPIPRAHGAPVAEPVEPTVTPTVEPADSPSVLLDDPSDDPPESR